MFSMTINGQQIGAVRNGEYLIELHKTNNIYSCFYSDINKKPSTELKSFQFPNINRVFTIIMDGFEHDKNHKTYVLTNKDTVVKFEFSKIDGVVLLKMKHNNLIDNTIGSTAYLNKEQIRKLFGIENRVSF